MNARVLGRVKVCAASSLIAAYASTSTMIPEHSPQTSSAPISSRAHVSGSRLKKDARITRLIKQGLVRPLVFLLFLEGASGRLVVKRNLHIAFDRFAITERRNEFGFAKISESGIAESKQRRLFR